MMRTLRLSFNLTLKIFVDEELAAKSYFISMISMMKKLRLSCNLTPNNFDDDDFAAKSCFVFEEIR